MTRFKSNRWLSSLVAGIFAFVIGTAVAQMVQRPLHPSTGKSAGLSYFSSSAAPSAAADGELAMESQGVGSTSTLQFFDSASGADAWVVIPDTTALAAGWATDVVFDPAAVSHMIWRDDFCAVGVVQNDFTAEAGADTNVNDIHTAAGGVYYQFIEQTATLSLAQAANTAGAGCGLDVSGDVTANDGHEIRFAEEELLGVHMVNSANDEWYFEISITIADISAFDGDWATGLFVPATQVNPPVHDNFDTYVLFTLSDNAGDLDFEADVDGGGAANDDTGITWADAATHVLRIEIDGDGYAAYVDGTAVTVTNVNASGANDFTDLDKVVPFYYHTQGAEGAASGVVINYVEWGFGSL